MIYQFTADGDRLHFLSINEGVTGNVNTYECAVEFQSEDWAGLEKFAAFKVGAELYTRALVNGRCTIPSQALEQAQAIYVGVYGIDPTGSQEKKLSTQWEVLNISEGALQSGATTPKEPQPDVWETYIGEIVNIRDNMTPYVGENGNWFVWDKETQAMADSGREARGEPGYTPQKGVDYFTENDIQSLGLDKKVDKVAGKGLSTNDYSTKEKSKLSGIEAGAEKNKVSSVAGKTGDVVVSKSDIGLGNVNNTSDLDKPVSNAVQKALALKADFKNAKGGFNAGEYSTTAGGTGVAIGYHAGTVDGGAVGNAAHANAGGGAVGNSAYTDNGASIGYHATSSQGSAAGCNAKATTGAAAGDTARETSGGAALGDHAKAAGGGAVGSGAVAQNGFAGGLNAVAANAANTPIDAIQLGTGKNGSEKTLQVYDYPMMDADGNIPSERIPQLNGKADKASTLAGYGIEDAYTRLEVDSKISRIYKPKGSVFSVDRLPRSAETGDVYNVVNGGEANFASMDLYSGTAEVHIGLCGFDINMYSGYILMDNSVPNLLPAASSYTIIEGTIGGEFVSLYVTPGETSTKYYIQYSKSLPLKDGVYTINWDNDHPYVVYKLNLKDGDNVVWVDVFWDQLPGTVDLSGYVQKETGKGLSANDFTDAEKAKLEGIEAGAQVNAVTPEDLALKADMKTEDGGFAAGSNSITETGGAIGDNGYSISGGAVGDTAIAGSGGAVGQETRCGNGGAIGQYAIAASGFSGGYNAKTMDNNGNAIDAIQLGTGTNPNAKTLQVYDYPMMDADGNIPTERIPQLADKADKADTWTKQESDVRYLPKGTAAGNPVTVTDHQPGAELIECRIHGNAVQETRSGKNLFNIQDFADLDNVEVEGNNLIITGTAAKNNATIPMDRITGRLKPNTTYTTCVGAQEVLEGTPKTSTFYIGFVPKTGSANFYLKYSVTSNTRTLPEDLSQYEYFIIFCGPGVKIKMSDIMIEEGNTQTEYEPYGVMPSPEFPSAVQSVGDLVTEGEHAGQYRIPVMCGEETADIYLSKPLLAVKNVNGGYVNGDCMDAVNGEVTYQNMSLAVTGDYYNEAHISTAYTFPKTPSGTDKTTGVATAIARVFPSYTVRGKYMPGWDVCTQNRETGNAAAKNEIGLAGNMFYPAASADLAKDLYGCRAGYVDYYLGRIQCVVPFDEVNSIDVGDYASDDPAKLQSKKLSLWFKHKYDAGNPVVFYYSCNGTPETEQIPIPPLTAPESETMTVSVETETPPAEVSITYCKSTEAGRFETVRQAKEEAGQETSMALGELESYMDERLEALQNAINVLSESAVPRYGVRFTGGANPGVRLYNAAGMTAGVGTDTETAVNDFDHVYPFAGRRRCCGYFDEAGDFVVNAYQGEPGYTTDGSNGEVWVETPLFYYKHTQENDIEEVVISPCPLGGYEPSPIHIRKDGSLIQKAYTAAYPMGEADGKPTSRSGVYTSVVSLNTAMEKARILGSQFTTTTAAEQYTKCLLMWVEFATRNLQSVMMGCCSLAYSGAHTAVIAEESTNRIVITNANADAYVIGQGIAIGTALGSINVANNRTVTAVESYDDENTAILFDGEPVNIAVGNIVFAVAWKTGSCDSVLTSSGSPVSNTSGKYDCIYRGEESPYGNAYEWISDVLFKREGEGASDSPYSYDIYYLKDPAKYAGGSITVDYVKINYQLPTSEGYVKKLGYDSRFPWLRLPCEVGANPLTYYSDYYDYPKNIVTAAYVNGSFALSLYCGINYWGCNYVPSYVNLNRRARLSYRR